MSGDNYYLLTFLPGLGELGTAVPLTPADLLEQAQGIAGAELLLKTIFLSDDLLQHQAYLAGETKNLDPTVLTKSQAADEEPLPTYLAVVKDERDTEEVNPDRYWENYYRYAAQQAKKYSSRFLTQWVGFEVQLRNALTEERAKILALDALDYLVAADLGNTDLDFSGIINEWSAAPDPFAGLRVLDNARWKWLRENDGWFSFENDEIAAYGAKLMLLHRRFRLGDKQSAPTVND
ncbi:MAG: DUF2764 family protein [Sedimentisphaerales bacterium]|nr:DUF2764 family protein [Sedimentisphaerales bacterium]